MTSPTSLEFDMPIWTSALGYAAMHALILSSLLFVMFMQRIAWILLSLLALLFAVMVSFDVIPTAMVNPHFAIQKLEEAITQ